MPLGFANSVFSTLPAVAGAVGLEAIDPQESFNSDTTTIGTSDSSGTVDVTISLWFKDDNNTTGEDTLFMLKHTSGGNSLLQFNYQGGRIRLIGLDGSVGWGFDYFLGTYSTTYGSGTYDDGEWHHVVFSRDGSASTEYLYVDGVDQTSNITVNAGRQSFSAVAWQGDEWSQVSLLSEGGGNTCGVFVTQLFVDRNYYDLSTGSVLDKFYDGGAVDMGTDGTNTGLTQPRMFHTGDSGDFMTKGGNTSAFDYTISTSGTAADISAENGPQFG